MKFCHPFAIRTFNHFNKLCFGGKLPDVPIEIYNAGSTLGQCKCKIGHKPDGSIVKYDFRLRFSERADLPENELEDIILHEMIHYYIDVNQFQDTAPHGVLFRQKMTEINTTYGRHITVSHKSTKEQREKMQDTRQRWHVIAVLSMKDGHKGIKVLPRVLQSILKYYNGVLKSPQVASVELYMSNDIFFNQYPNSSSLNYHRLDETVINNHLKGADKLECDGKNIIQK